MDYVPEAIELIEVPEEPNPVYTVAVQDAEHPEHVIDGRTIEVRFTERFNEHQSNTNVARVSRDGLYALYREIGAYIAAEQRNLGYC